MPKPLERSISTSDAKRQARIARQRAEMDDMTYEVYCCVRDYLHQHRRPPTVREIGAGVYTSHTTVYRHLDKLVGMGWLSREANMPRSIILGEYAPDYHEG